MKLYEHQRKGLEDTKRFNKVAYFWDMGTGKTFVGSEKAISFRKKILLVCQLSKLNDWKKHFLEYYAPKIVLYDLTKKEELEQYVKTQCSYYIKVGVINYDKIFRRNELKNLKDFTLMLDESSIIQNENTSRASAILKMNFENIILLSGTPISGKYEKLWSQSHLLGWKISKKLFLKHYTITEKFELPNGNFTNKIVGYKNVERLKRKLREYGANFLKTEEVIDLPKQTFIDINHPTSKDYEIFKKIELLQ